LTLCLVLAPDSPLPPSAQRAALPDVVDGGKRLPTNEEMEKLARTHPTAFVENCIRRYNRDVKGYHCTLHKQEQVGRRLGPFCVLDVSFHEDPFRVLLRWKEGAGLAQAVLYAAGKNNGSLVVLPTGLFSRVGPVERDPHGPEARRTSRYPIDQFGLKAAMQRTLAGWKKAEAQGTLHVEYLGQRRVKELGNRRCFVLRRTQYARPEEDGVTGATVYFDTETWLQVGSVVRGEGNRLIGEYFFRSIQLNPTFPPETFTRDGLAPRR
jgi:hypothetical protein